jgi:hypothetical protein
MNESPGRSITREPFSRRKAATQSRLRAAAVTESVCPYCAVGGGLLVFTKAEKVIAIEGNPESPVNEGRLCPKGANTLQLDAIAVGFLRKLDGAVTRCPRSRHNGMERRPPRTAHSRRRTGARIR